MADVLGIHGKDANPHLWYDVPRLDRIAGAIADRARARGSRATPLPTAPARRRFERSLAAAAARGRRDPVPLPRCPGRVHRAGARLPRRGGRASTTSRPTRSRGRSRREPSRLPRPWRRWTRSIAKHRIRVLLYNSQAVSPITAQLRDDARKAGIPVVPVTETLPPHLTFQQWQLEPGPRARGRARER